MFDLLFKNGKIVTADRTFEAAIGVKDGKIVYIGEDTDMEAKEVVDAQGKYIMPGGIDPHTHIQWPNWDWEEDCVCTTKSAAAGGVTTVIHYLNEPRDLIEQFEERVVQYEKNAIVAAAFHEGIFDKNEISEIREMSTKRGICSYKFYLPYRGSEAVGNLVGIDDGIIYLGFREIGKLTHPALACIHAENAEVFFSLKEEFIKQGVTPYWTDTRPNWVEVESIRRVVAFAKATGCPLYLVHLTTREAEEEILRARAEGVTCIGETCPQYLVLNIDNVDNVMGKINPPIRRKEDNEALWRAIQNGVITCIGSDSGDVASKDKKEFWSAIVGTAQLQTMLPIIFSEGVNKGRIDINKAVAITSTNAAKTFGLYPQKGTIEVGSDADIIIVDMDLEREVHMEDMYYINDFTVYEGWKFKGWPVETFVRGTRVMKDNKIMVEPGYGKYVPRYAKVKEE